MYTAEKAQSPTMSMQDVINETGLSRKEATRLLNHPTAPILPRVKNSPFKIPRKAFWDWYDSAKWND